MITHDTHITNTAGRTHAYRITQIEHGSCDEFIVFNMDSGDIYQTTLDACTCPSNEKPVCKHIHAVRKIWLEWLAARPVILRQMQGVAS